MNKNYEQALSSVDGETVISFVPDGTEKLAIIPLAILQRLADLLPKTNLEQYKTIACDAIGRSKDLKTIVTFYEQEVSFHNSVNLIQEYTAEQLKSALEKRNIPSEENVSMV